ncbi:MAG TPA: hypothetical protein VF613_16080 [Longimicrobium sp.]|jgi:hypothetical protein
MRKWMAAATVVAVLTAAGCKKDRPAGAAGAAAGSTASTGGPAAGAPADEETVPGGFTVDTQKVENLSGAGTTVNEPD